MRVRCGGCGDEMLVGLELPSYCTLFDRSDDEPWAARFLSVWILIHVTAAVIELACADGEASGAPAAFYRVGGDAELDRDLRQGQQTGFSQPGAASSMTTSC